MSVSIRNILGRQYSIGDLIPYAVHVTDRIVKLRDSDRYTATLRLDGIPFTSVEDELLALKKDQLNTIYKAVGLHPIALWSHVVRRKFYDRLDAAFPNPYCEQYNDDYFDAFTRTPLLKNEIYLTIIFDANPSVFGSGAKSKNNRSIEEYVKFENQSVKRFNEILDVIESSLRSYGVETLTTYTDEFGTLCSQPMAFYQFLLSGKWQKMAVGNKPIYEQLGGIRYLPGVEIGRIRTPSDEKCVQFLTVTEFPENTFSGMLDALMAEDHESILTQSFTFLPKRKGIDILKRQAQLLQSSGDLAATQLTEMVGEGGALDQATQGAFVLGEYHFSVMVIGDTPDEVQEHKSSTVATLQDLGFVVRVEDAASAAYYFAQLPGQFENRPRIANITSRNFAGLASFHNYQTGKRDRNPWGQAVTMLQTPTRTPLYFNFHYTREDEDSEEKKVSANTLILGQTGSGKTVLMADLFMKTMKYEANAPKNPTGKRPFSMVFLDKDYGGELLVRRMGGRYFSIENGVKTGLNPFQMDDTVENREFLLTLLKYIASHTDGTTVRPLTLSHEKELGDAVTLLMQYDKPLRTLSNLVNTLLSGGKTAAEKEDSLPRRLQQWIGDNPYAYVFDNPNDLLSFESHVVTGIDGTDFLDNKVTRTPISMYILHRMTQIIDGRRFAYFMDEFWKWIGDPIFGQFAKDMQKTIRKRNGFGVLATQSPSDILKNENSAAMVEQSVTQIFLPNPKADKNDYVEGFKVSEVEYNLVKEMPLDSRMMLIKQSENAMLGQLNLRGFDDYLAIFSGSSETVALYHEIAREYGENNPQIWDIFHERRKARIRR